MGLFDRVTPGEEDPPRREEPYEPEEYGYDDFSDEVRVWIVDRWPSYKPLTQYDLMFIEDRPCLDARIQECGLPNRRDRSRIGGKGIVGQACRLKKSVSASFLERAEFHHRHHSPLIPSLVPE